MSRIGKLPISIPQGVEVNIDNDIVIVKGQYGNISQKIDGKRIRVKIEDNKVIVDRNYNNSKDRSLHGLYRAIINNMIEGVNKQFVKELELVGVGYRAKSQGRVIDLSLGFSHNILFEVPKEVKVETITKKGSNPIIKLTSYDKQLLGAVASKIRSLRPPEPYKGKGVKFVGEQIRRKSGKKT